MTIRENISLKKLNTFGIDATARYFASFGNVDDLIELLSTEQSTSTRKLILGGGSNLLFTKDFDGIVMKNDIKGITVSKEDNDHFYIKAGAGEVWHEFVMHCINNN